MSSFTEWRVRLRSDEIVKKQLQRQLAKDHPLKSLTVTERIPRRILGSQPSTGRTTPVSLPASIIEPLSQALEGLDPLTEFAIQEMDPLSRIAAEMENTPLKEKADNKTDQKNSSFVQAWNVRKAQILNKFTTSEKISIVTSFLSEGEKVVVRAQSTVVDKVQDRLEQLDYFEEGSQRKLELSQSEYINRIEQLNKELVKAWNSEQRVKALKIAIQCAKLLADTDVLFFYPSKFVLITDILDIFGQLVYDRLRSKISSPKSGSKAMSLPENFTADMVPEQAKETCLNWFYKIASIRELIPRIYVEMALLRSYNFLSAKHAPDALMRISQMIQGVGNPLVAVYARCYLCRVGVATCTPIDNNHDYNTANFIGFLNTYQHIFTRTVKSSLSLQNVPMATYMSLYTPALDFILETLTCNASENVLNELLDKCTKQGNCSLILNSTMSALKPMYVADRALTFLEIILQPNDDGIPLHVLLRTLGLCLSVSPPSVEHRKKILSTVWQYIGGFGEPEQYISCAEAWVPYVVKYFSFREINTVLGDIINHMIPKRTYERFTNQLKLIVENIVSHVNDLETLLVMDNFVPLLDMFHEESVRVYLAKYILKCCNNEQTTSDPVITNAMMYLCVILHDSVNALTPDDEQRQIGDILCNIIRKIDYGRDLEQQLAFYVEARGSFSNIDSVLAFLVQGVNSLAMKTREMVMGQHSRKTSDFVRGCAAYCFITIPSISSVKTRLELYLLSGQVALSNQCLGQADACFKAIIGILPEVQEDATLRNEAFLVAYIKHFLSVLLIVPDNPDQGVLSITRMLLNLLQTYTWDKQNASLTFIYMSVIDMLSAMAQDELIYSISKVENNCTLYGGDPKFISEINKMCSIIVGEVLSHLKELGSCRKQSILATDLFMRIMLRGDLSHKPLALLANNLWQLSLRHGYADSKLMARIRDYFRRYSNTIGDVYMQQLVEQLSA